MNISITIKIPERLPRYFVFGGCLVFALLGSAIAWASVPNVFKDGDVLTAQALNDNFSAAAPPPGTVVAYAGDPTKVPAGWLLCDGANVQRTLFPALFAAIGTSWGSVDGVSFNLPDLRGRFLRGVSGSSNNDPDCASRTAPTGGTAGCNAAGTTQADAIPAHNHTIAIQLAGGAQMPYLASLVSSQNNGAANPLTTSTFGTGTESRPKNAAVAYIIKL